MSAPTSFIDPFWTTLTLEPHESRRWDLGPLSLWIRRAPVEWQIVTAYSKFEADDARWSLAQPSSFPPNAKVRRFAVESDSNELKLEPVYPDRSIVAKPAEPIEIPAGARANFVCGVPLDVRVSGGGRELAKILTRNLSKTWFGSRSEGEACYGTSTSAARDHQQLPILGFRALCPVRILNRSKKALLFERICLRVRHLDLYHGASGLWANEVGIIKTSEEEASRVVYRDGAPQQDEHADLVFKANKKPPSDGLVARTFSGIRSLIDLT